MVMNLMKHVLIHSRIIYWNKDLEAKVIIIVLLQHLLTLKKANYKIYLT